MEQTVVTVRGKKYGTIELSSSSMVGLRHACSNPGRGHASRPIPMSRAIILTVPGAGCGVSKVDMGCGNPRGTPRLTRAYPGTYTLQSDP